MRRLVLSLLVAVLASSTLVPSITASPPYGADPVLNTKANKKAEKEQAKQSREEAKEWKKCQAKGTCPHPDFVFQQTGFAYSDFWEEDVCLVSVTFTGLTTEYGDGYSLETWVDTVIVRSISSNPWFESATYVFENVQVPVSDTVPLEISLYIGWPDGVLHKQEFWYCQGPI